MPAEAFSERDRDILAAVAWLQTAETDQALQNRCHPPAVAIPAILSAILTGAFKRVCNLAQTTILATRLVETSTIHEKVFLETIVRRVDASCR